MLKAPATDWTKYIYNIHIHYTDLPYYAHMFFLACILSITYYFLPFLSIYMHNYVALKLLIKNMEKKTYNVSFYSPGHK